MITENFSILIVEDDAIVAKDLEKSIQGLGYSVVGCISSGENAIIDAEKSKPDLILMDIMLSGNMDGISAAQQILKRSHIPVVYLTAYADNATIERAKETEPCGYLLKPFDEMLLKTTIEMAIHKSKIIRRVKESEEKYRALVEMSPDAIIHTDLEGKILTTNEKCAKIFGYNSVDEILSTVENPFNFIVPKDHERASENMKKTVQGNSQDDIEYQLYRKDGTTFYAAVSSSVINDDKANPKGFITIMRDITEYKKMIEDTHKTEKLESIGLLAGGIAHDFNNLLGSLFGYIDLAKESLSHDGEASLFLNKALTAFTRAKDLTKQLLTFSKGGTPITKVLAIDPIVRNAVAFVLHGSNIRAEYTVEKDLQTAEVDEGQITQVVHNIIINAKQAMPEGGIITIDMKNTETKPGNESLCKDGPYIAISITDSGIGIPQEGLLKVFDPFYTTKQSGSGIGLASSHSIIKKHNGHITIESDSGKGTTVTFYLPASNKVADANENIHELGATIGKGRILIMDDEELMRMIAGDMLTKRGYEVFFAKNGEEAIESYQKAYNTENEYHTVILDLTIAGGMGGSETIMRLKEINPEIRAIVSSGYSNNKILAMPKEYGFKAAVKKPFRIRELVTAVHQVVQA